VESRDASRLRALARAGALSEAVRNAGASGCAALTASAYELVWPVVYVRLTRVVERRRGHWQCSRGLTRLAAECADRFHDDVEAVVADLLEHARVPIGDVEAWVGARLTAVTVDGHRRRRGARGALQRPRMPGWLAAELGHDPWLTELALRALDWVGIPDTAGCEVWPMGSWAARRTELTGQPTRAAAVRADLDRVLAAMRRRPRWYATYVERPLDAKPAPVGPPPGDGPGYSRPLPPESPDEADERRLDALAADAVAAIAAGIGRGDDPRRTVMRVLETMFGAGSYDMDRAPGADPGLDQLVSTRLVSCPETCVKGKSR
jgi:hypothetical protein